LWSDIFLRKVPKTKLNTNNHSFVLLTICVVSLLLYFKTTRFELTNFDDTLLIEIYRWVFKKPADIFKAFTDDVFFAKIGIYYRPVLTVSFLLDNLFGRYSMVLHHLTNILFHILSSFMVFLLLKKFSIKEKTTLFLVAFFLVHPVLVQAVAWLPGRNDSLLTVFLLASFLLFIESMEKERVGQFLLQNLLFALAVFTKETAIFAPAVFVFYWLLYVLPKNKKSLKNIVMYVLSWSFCVYLWIVIRTEVLGEVNKVFTSYAIQAGLINIRAFPQYIFKLVFPVSLSPLPSIYDTPVYFGLGSILLIIFAIFFTKYKDYRNLAFGALWFIIFLVPSFFTHNTGVNMGGDYILEHRLYLPFFGALLVFSEISFLKNSWRKIYPAIFVLIILLLAVKNYIYQDTFSGVNNFWKYAVKMSPKLGFARLHLAEYHISKGEVDQALEQLSKIKELEGNMYNLNYNLGQIYMNKVELEKAKESFEKEISSYKYNKNGYYGLANYYFVKGDSVKAEYNWNIVLVLDPLNSRAMNSLIVNSVYEKNKSKGLKYIEMLKNSGIPVHPKLLEDVNNLK